MPTTVRWKRPIRANAGIRVAEIAPLDAVGWLAERPPEFQDWAKRHGRWRRYAAGQFVYQVGDRADGVYGLAEGSLDISFPLIAEEPVTIHRTEIGFWIGDSAELAEVPRILAVRAVLPSRLLHLPSGAIRDLLVEHPHHWREFYALSSQNATTAVALLSEALALTVRARVCRRLLMLADGSGDVSVTQEDLGRVVGAARTTLRRCLADLENRGGIELRYRRVSIVDRSVLSSFKDEQ
ncbi:MAG: Crp/Fnr family transcriptional regulator [Pseudomonadales bacterium]